MNEDEGIEEIFKAWIVKQFTGPLVWTLIRYARLQGEPPSVVQFVLKKTTSSRGRLSQYIHL